MLVVLIGGIAGVIAIVIGVKEGGKVERKGGEAEGKGGEAVEDENRLQKMCVYNTPENFLPKLPSETFEYAEQCTIGSKFVNKTCSIGKEKSDSRHVCDKCTDGSILPSFCFCDKKVHCVKDLESRPADHHSKNTCKWCQGSFNIHFKNRGNPSCSSDKQALVETTCNEGYTGFMCSVITKRLCTLELKQHNLHDLHDCNRSNLEEKCFLETICPEKYYYCQPFTDSDIKERDQEACNLNPTP
ncbi:unnamed protein product [Mytilus coruscus]|uniref:Uncharacterized protein n=1 Tax=Mytilus coruscus TaxID=42192 RepID=A0A6J8A570_MYTCO|nr:unnamed protein product [Mytilus coruscus]